MTLKHPDRLKRAHDQVGQTADEHTAACRRLHKLVHDAMADGARAADLADLFGIHRQRIYAYQRSHRERLEQAGLAQPA